MKSSTAPSRDDPVVVFPLCQWCPPQETSQPHPPHGQMNIKALQIVIPLGGESPSFTVYFCLISPHRRSGMLCFDDLFSCIFSPRRSVMKSFDAFLSMGILHPEGPVMENIHVLCVDSASTQRASYANLWCYLFNARSLPRCPVMQAKLLLNFIIIINTVGELRSTLCTIRSVPRRFLDVR